MIMNCQINLLHICLCLYICSATWHCIIKATKPLLHQCHVQHIEDLKTLCTYTKLNQTYRYMNIDREYVMNQISKKKSNKTYYSLINVSKFKLFKFKSELFQQICLLICKLETSTLGSRSLCLLIMHNKSLSYFKSQVYRNEGLWQFLQTNDPKLAAIWLLTITKSIETRDWFLENHLHSSSTIVKDFNSYVSMQHYIAWLVGWRFHMNQNKENVWRIERETHKSRFQIVFSLCEKLVLHVRIPENLVANDNFKPLFLQCSIQNSTLVI
jgi:hypothetical protein